MYTQLGLYIDGEWLNGDGRQGEEVVNPATGKSLARLPHASASDLDRALAAAQKGLAVWRATSAYDRAKIMRKAADLLRERYDAVSKILTQEQGKTYPEARAEVFTTADIIEWYAEEGRRSLWPHRAGPGEGHAANGRAGAGRHRRRLHAVEFPHAHAGAQDRRRARRRLLADHQGVGGDAGLGCRARALLRRCGPAGRRAQSRLRRAGEYLRASAWRRTLVRKISFTGSIPVGKHLAGLAAKGMKRATMELGGHSPVVVFGDTDPEKAADTIAAFKYRNAGQVCISPTRFYVQEPVYDRFLTRFTEYANNIKLGDGLEKGVTMGPLANARRLDAMEALVNDSKSRGGKIVTGGKRHGNQGYFFEPTVVTDIPDDSKLMTQEPFGPIAPIVAFKSFDEVVERANSLPYGLAAYAFTSSAQTATAIGDALESGMVGVNSIAISTPETPFGGVKESGYGHEGGIEGLEAYTNRKFISQA